MEAVKATVAGEELLLHPLKGAFWPKEGALLIADLHLGKVSHFRRAGIAIPNQSKDWNFIKLSQLINAFPTKQVIFLGDLFHSDYNNEWEMLVAFLADLPELQIHLVMGNHDILSDYQYTKMEMEMHKHMDMGPFRFTHHPPEKDPNDGKYYISGHIHPGVKLRGNGRQSLVLPSFYFGKQSGIFPAFGDFTGCHKINPKKNDQIYVVANDEVLKVG